MEGEDGQLTGRHSLADASVAREVCAWLAVMTKLIGFENCV